jgi:hypothetical protein
MQGIFQIFPQRFSFCCSTFRNRLLSRSVLFCQPTVKFCCNPSPLTVFDRNLKRIQKDRAACTENSREFDYLREEIAKRLLDRLDVCSLIFIHSSFKRKLKLVSPFMYRNSGCERKRISNCCGFGKS